MQSPLVSVGMGVQLVRLVEKGEFRVSEVAVLSLPDLAATTSDLLPQDLRLGVQIRGNPSVSIRFQQIRSSQITLSGLNLLRGLVCARKTNLILYPTIPSSFEKSIRSTSSHMVVLSLFTCFSLSRQLLLYL